MPAEIVVTPAQLGPEVRALFARLVEANRAAGVKALQRAARFCQAEAVRAIGEVRPYVPVDTGELRRSYVVTDLPDGAKLENTAPHAAFMEFGTRPHWAPLSALEAWAERKMRGKIKSRAKRVGSDAVKALARATQRAIAKRGLAARGFHAKASQKFPAIVEREIRAAVAKVFP